MFYIRFVGYPFICVEFIVPTKILAHFSFNIHVVDEDEWKIDMKLL